MTLLFDIGRVLLDFDFSPSISRLFPPEVTDRERRMSLLLEHKDDFEAGKISVDSFIPWALKTLGSHATADEFRHAWCHIFTPNEPMWDRARQLAADGHRLILFSNINGIHWPWVTQEFPEFSLFPEAVLSFRTGYIKPQAGIYLHAIDTYRLVPAETLYIDDMPANCTTGRDLGFRTWQYDLNDHAAFEHWLAQNLKSQI